MSILMCFAFFLKYVSIESFNRLKRLKEYIKLLTVIISR